MTETRVDDQVSVDRDALIEVLRFTERCETDYAVTDAELRLRDSLMCTEPERRTPRLVGMTAVILASVLVFGMLGLAWILAVTR